MAWPDKTVDAPSPSKLGALSLAALGIVFGDIGTSPLYTFKTVLNLTGARPDADARGDVDDGVEKGIHDEPLSVGTRLEDAEPLSITGWPSCSAAAMVPGIKSTVFLASVWPARWSTRIGRSDSHHPHRRHSSPIKRQSLGLIQCVRGRRRVSRSRSALGGGHGDVA